MLYCSTASLLADPSDRLRLSPAVVRALPYSTCPIARPSIDGQILHHQTPGPNTLFYRDFTEAEIEGRRQMRLYADFFRRNLAGCAHSFVEDSGVQVGVRQTRQVEGKAKLDNAEVLSGRKFADGIARSP